MELNHIRVRDAMRSGILSCPADASLREVAAIMARNRVHAVVVSGNPGQRPAGVVRDMDLVRAAASGAEPRALEAVSTQPHAVSADASVHRAAQLMAQHSISHLVVQDAASGYPIGILSTLDIAAVYAGRTDEPASTSLQGADRQ